MEKADVQKALEGAGLKQLVQDVDRIAREAIRLSVTPVDEAKLPVGASKLGGQPDIPAGMTWPVWKGVPQAFVAQIKLEDVHQYDTHGELPERGTLWFFYDAQQETYGENPEDRGGWQVFFAETPTGLQRTPFPAHLPKESRFKAGVLHFSSELTFALQPDLEIPGMDWNDEKQEKYDQVYATLTGSGKNTAPQHQMFGFAHTLQDDMRLQCQLVTHGITDIDDPRAKELEAGANDWKLLLQIDSDEQTGMQWASVGILYYWIRQTDLQARRFDAAWVVVQSS